MEQPQPKTQELEADQPALPPTAPSFPLFTRHRSPIQILGDVLQRIGVYLGQDAMPRMAAALAYRTVFSLIPFLVLSFLVFRLFPNYENLVQDFINQALSRSGLSALSTDKESVGDWIKQLVGKFQGINFGAIGAVSAAVFIYGALSLLVDIESAFNAVYGASRARSWGRRIAHYWLIVTLGPLCISAGFAVGEKFNNWAQASVRQVTSLVDHSQAFVGPPAPPEVFQHPDPNAAPTSNPAGTPAADSGMLAAKPDPAATPSRPFAGTMEQSTDGWFTAMAIRIVGYSVTITISAILLLVLYTTVPNTTVRLVPAISGAYAGGVLLEVAKSAFQAFFRTDSYTTLYGSLALLPLFLLWVYITWFIVLFGLRVSFLVQHGRSGALLSAFRASTQTRIGASWLEPAHAVGIVVTIAERFVAGKTSHLSRLSEENGIDEPTTRNLLHRLEEYGILNRVSSEGREETYSLARPADAISVAEVVSVGQSLAGPPPSGPAGELVLKVRAAQIQAVAGVTLASLVKKEANPALKAVAKTVTPVAPAMLAAAKPPPPPPQATASNPA